ncbi:MAG: hypothetical protein JZD41_02740, partial [Thermoproteus sp.]|nr:hypothetical protein [Thermoproteus sp.]
GKYRKALERLRPLLEELDALLGSVSRKDKVQLVGKIVDYDGNVEEGLLRVSAEAIKEMPIELGGVKIRMADVAEAAAKAFSEKGGWHFWIDKEGKLHIGKLSLGPAKDIPELKVDKEAPLKAVDAPAYKAVAALIAQETRKGADELRRKDLVKHGEPIKYKIGEVEIKITPAKAMEELTPITRLEEVWKGFEVGKYTHLRLVVRGEEYDLLGKVKSRSAGRVNVEFEIRGEGARRLAEALKGLGLKDVKRTPGGYLYLDYEHLKALLDKGVEAEAVRRAKRGEAQWRLEITYGGVTIVLEMTYNERRNRLEKKSRTGKIKAIVYEEGAAEGERVELDLELLAAAGGGCKDCLEKRLAEALNIASEKGFRWSVTSDRKYLYVYLPSDFRDVVRRSK